MTLTKCTCGFQITTKNAIKGRKIEWDTGTWHFCVTCPVCKSSAVLIFKRKKAA